MYRLLTTLSIAFNATSGTALTITIVVISVAFLTFSALDFDFTLQASQSFPCYASL